MHCDYDYYLYSYSSDNYETNDKCIKNQKNISNCKSFRYDVFVGDIVCSLCKSGYYNMDGKCYRIPSKIKNCNVHEEFYTNEVSCLNPIDDEESVEEIKDKKDKNSLNFGKHLFLKYYYLLFLYFWLSIT